MDQEQIFIHFLDGSEVLFTKNLDIIKEKLIERENVKWLLFDYEGPLVDQENLEISAKLRAIRVQDIPVVFDKYPKSKAQEEELKNLKKKIQEQGQELQNFIELNKIIPAKAIVESKLEEKCKNYEIAIQSLKDELEILKKENQEQESSSNSIKNNNYILRDGYTKIQKEKKELTESQQKLQESTSKKLNELEYQFQQASKDFENKTQELQNQRNQLNNELSQKQQEVCDLKIHSDNLQQEMLQSNNKVVQFQKKSNDLLQELKQSKEQIDNLNLEKQNLFKELLQSKDQINFLQNQSNNQSKQQLPQKQITSDLSFFYTDEKQQENYQIYSIQNKEDQPKNEDQNIFLTNIINKLLDENRKLKDISNSTHKGSTYISTNELQIYLITLVEVFEFTKCIKAKNFFLRNKCISQVRCYPQNNIALNQSIFPIVINGKEITIQKLYQLSKSDYEAIDIILNKLVVQSYFTLFQRDLFRKQQQDQQQNQNWNLQIPKQFMVKDQLDNYYVYQEHLQIQNTNFNAFQNTSVLDQYLSSFFRYFYLATNKNLVLTECQYGLSYNNEIVLSSIIIHSLFPKGFSFLDQGRSKIEEFEEISKAPGGIAQTYWSDFLQTLAQQVWNDQQQQ